MTDPQAFIDKWKQTGGAELANSQPFQFGARAIIEPLKLTQINLRRLGFGIEIGGEITA